MRRDSVLNINRAYSKQTREEWLNRVAVGMAPLFKQAGAPLPQRFRVTMSITKKTARKTHLGVCYAPSASGDRTTEILIRIDRHRAMDVAGILAHELVHAAVGCDKGHGQEFEAVARAIGLEGKPTETHAGPRLKEALKPVLREAGPFPHAPLNIDARKRSGPPKQSSRLLKAECEKCGYTVRAAISWLLQGAPLCPAEGCGRKPMSWEPPEAGGVE